MLSVVLANKVTNEVIQCQSVPDPHPDFEPYKFGEQMLNRRGLDIDDYHILLLPMCITPRQFNRQFMVENGEITAKVESFEEAQERLLASVKRDYAFICDGIDPQTEERLSVVCGDYTMDAGKSAVTTLRDGIELAELLELPVLVLRDFYNVDHEVTIAVARQVLKEQASDALYHWERKNQIHSELTHAESLGDFDSISMQILK